MDYINSLETGLYFILNGCLFYGIYLIARVSVVSFRNKAIFKASRKEKLRGYIYCILIVSLISLGISFFSTKNPDTVFNLPLALKIFEVASVVSVYGVYAGYRDDAKLTPKEREKNYALSLKKDSTVDQEY